MARVGDSKGSSLDSKAPHCTGLSTTVLITFFLLLPLSGKLPVEKNENYFLLLCKRIIKVFLQIKCTMENQDILDLV